MPLNLLCLARLITMPVHAVAKVCGIILATMMIAPAGAADVVLRPHQAIYRMTLAPGSRTLDVAGAEGVMVYRAARACGGWTVENHTVIRYQEADGETFEDKWAFASWEADDGLSYRFRLIHRSGEEAERIEGNARLDHAGGSGMATYSEPEDVEIDLPQGTLFPTAHLRQLIAAATGSESILTRVVFDGTTLDNPYLVNIAIAPLLPDNRQPAETLGAPAAPGFWTRGAYFPYFGDSEIPDFEMTIEMRTDGVAERVEQFFHDMGLRGTLLSLEILQPPDC